MKIKYKPISFMLLLTLVQVVIMNSCNLQKSKEDDTRTASFDEG